jgi:ribosome maturation factor RimP
MQEDFDTSDDRDESPQGAIDRVRAHGRLLEGVVGPVVATMGFELVHLEWLSTARPRVLRLYVDCEAGTTLDDCARLSPILSNALDAAEAADDGEALVAVLGGAYLLEVSSPGVERPLSRRSQFERHVGQRATVRTHAPLSAESTQKTFHGSIAGTTPGPDAADDHEGVVLFTDDDGTLREIPLALVRRANLVYQPPEPSGGPRSGRRPPQRATTTPTKAVNRG